MPRVRRTLACAVASLVAALGCERGTPPPPPELFAVHRLIDDRPEPAPPGLAWGRYLTIADEMRVTLTSLEKRRLQVLTAAAPVANRVTVPVPAEYRDGGWIGVQPMVLLPGSPGRPLPFHFFPPGTETADLDVGEAGDGAAIVAQIAPIPALESRDVVTPPLVLRAGSALEFGFAIEPLVYGRDVVPVEFRVSVEADGEARVVWRHVLDPSAREADRTWADGRVPLGEFAGRMVRLRLSTAVAGTGRSGTSLPLWADPVVLAPAPAHAPSVVLVSLDTLRARSVGTYGAERPTTPRLDAFGAEGVVFDAAYTPAPHTLPAHVSAFTGRYLRTHGIRSPLKAIAADVETLTEHLRARGYDTAAFTEDGFVVPGVGILRGFATYRENASPNVHEPLGQAATTFRAGVDWLSRHRDHPAFLFLHTYQVHFPYTPPPPYDTAFEPAERAPTDDERDRLRYEQETRYLDDEVAALLDAIDGLGLGVRTLVVIMSDHGEEFMEHGQRTHGFALYEESTHVPLMMRLPGVIVPGLRVDTPVSLVDVAPTILDLVDAAPLDGADGTSLVPLLRAGGAPAWTRRAVFSEAYSSLVAGESDLFAARLAQVHCIFQTHVGRNVCFDANLDPDERLPLAGDEQRTLSARIQTSTYMALKPAQPVAVPAAGPVDSGRAEKLRALGYVQ